ncbi:MAG: DinB family protein [Oscillospiraceae bacterium]|nr:DinB family protein [Oscillospiraceae bacterium]
MSDLLANDVRKMFDRAFATVRGILEVFPEDKFLEPHGDEYYIPSSIAYHIASFIDGAVAGGFRKDPDFRSKQPFGEWHGITRDRLPNKAALLAYYDEVEKRAKEELAGIDDAAVTAALPPEMARMGATQLGAYLGWMREISDHTGELNKMLIENGIDDVWK